MGKPLQPTPFTPNRFAFELVSQEGTRVAVQQDSGTATLSVQGTPLRNPTISAAAGVVVYERRLADRTRPVFRPLAGIASAPETSLPFAVNSQDATVRTPEFSRDGRYLAFIRRRLSGSDRRDRLFVWDTHTQVLLNNDGIQVRPPSSAFGAIALEVRPVLRPKGTLLGAVLAQFALAEESYVWTWSCSRSWARRRCWVAERADSGWSGACRWDATRRAAACDRFAGTA